MEYSDPFTKLVTGFLSDSLLPSKSSNSGYLPPSVPWDWVIQADELRGSALPVALIVCRHSAMADSARRANKIGLELGEDLGLGRIAVKDGLERLEAGGLVILDKKAGRKAVVKIQGCGNRVTKPRLGIPIPWTWVCKAAQCPTPALVVGLAAWRFASRKTLDSNFTIPLEGSTRKAKSLRRGARDLQANGLLDLQPSLPDCIRGKIRPKTDAIDRGKFE